MLVSLTVGKVDAGVAVLLTEDNRLVSSQPLVAWTPKHGVFDGSALLRKTDTRAAR